MAVSWYSPSSILTPGGVAAGLSDLGQVIASAPERQAQIQRQMEADARAKRDQAIQEIQLGGGYSGTDEGLAGIAEQQRKEREAVALQRKIASDSAAASLRDLNERMSYRPVEQALASGVIPQGTGAMLRPDVAQAAAQRQQQIKMARDAMARQEQEARMQNYASGSYNPLTVPMDEMAIAERLSNEGQQDRYLKRRLVESQIAAQRETPGQRMAREQALLDARTRAQIARDEFNNEAKSLRELEDQLAQKEQMIWITFKGGKRPEDSWFIPESIWSRDDQSQYDAMVKERAILSALVQRRRQKLENDRRNFSVTGTPNGMQVQTGETQQQSETRRQDPNTGAWWTFNGKTWVQE